MPNRLLIDANVLVDFLRQRSEAVAYIGGLVDQPFTSAIVVAELYAGVREGNERERLDRLVDGLRVVPATRAIAVKGGLHVRQYAKSHSVELADAMIAATAQVIGATLVTLNLKHFPMLQDVQQPY